MDEGYTVAGQSMPRITIGFGTFLAAWGIIISVISKSNSMTSFFPSLLGLPILISGLMAQKVPEKRKLWMHIAVVFGLLCAIGGTRFFMVMSKDDVSGYAKGSMLMLLVTGAIYTFFCVQSFKHARRNPIVEPTTDASQKKDSETTNIVQNITYNISDSVVSGGIDSTIEKN